MALVLGSEISSQARGHSVGHEWEKFFFLPKVYNVWFEYEMSLPSSQFEMLCQAVRTDRKRQVPGGGTLVVDFCCLPPFLFSVP